jgi:hypothetical protein
VNSSQRIPRHTVVIIEKEKSHEYFKNQNVIPPEYLKGTIWDDRQDMIAFPIPTIVPILLVAPVPTVNLTDPDYPIR